MSTPRLASTGRVGRSLVAQTPALIVATLALALSAGGAAYASNQLSTGPQVTSTVTFHKLSLINGWASKNSTYGTGSPSVAIANGVVYLSGSMAQQTPGSSEFAILPLAYRPAHNMWLTVYTLDETSGALYIAKNGTMEALSSGYCGAGTLAQCFTSLASVSYPKSS
jgi:hypothetical protein